AGPPRAGGRKGGQSLAARADHLHPRARGKVRRGSEKAAVLLDHTRQFKDVAGALRQAERGIDNAVIRWPELRTTLIRLTTLMKTARDQLDHACANQREYEAAMEQTIRLADTFASLLPLLTENLSSQLDQQDR